ncbi:MAG: hypothetical protein KJ749_13725 [Planctomycetes bacterium]|nr:hypothetical protein [Planctomycetota bacterium]
MHLHYRRRGSMYVMVLGCTMLVTVIGLSALALTRVERRTAEGTGSLIQARLYAMSAIEIGLHRIQNDVDWRTTYPNGVWETDQPIGTGTYTLMGTDSDGLPLDNDEMDPLVLTGIGIQGEAVYSLQVTLVAEETPLEALNTCLHAAGEIQVKAGDSVTVTGAPLSTNGNLRKDGIVYGDAQAATLSGGGTITGTATIPAPPKDFPDPGVLDTYRALATAAPLGITSIEGSVIGPGFTTWGITNPDGVYYIDTTGKDISIKESRIYGTLVVNAPGKKLVLEDPVFIHPARADYPALIVNGNVEFKYKSDVTVLSEFTYLTNYNPIGVPYEGASDPDLGDNYPNEVRGLVHVFGTITFIESARVRGVVLAESTVVCDKANEIVHDPALYTNPPMGYTAPPAMKISPGTWQRVVD